MTSVVTVRLTEREAAWLTAHLGRYTSENPEAATRAEDVLSALRVGFDEKDARAKGTALPSPPDLSHLLPPGQALTRSFTSFAEAVQRVVLARLAAANADEGTHSWLDRGATLSRASATACRWRARECAAEELRDAARGLAVTTAACRASLASWGRELDRVAGSRGALFEFAAAEVGNAIGALSSLVPTEPSPARTTPCAEALPVHAATLVRAVSLCLADAASSPGDWRSGEAWAELRRFCEENGLPIDFDSP